MIALFLSDAYDIPKPKKSLNISLVCGMRVLAGVIQDTRILYEDIHLPYSVTAPTNWNV